MEAARPNETLRHEPPDAGPRPARPLREEIGGALALVYAPSILGALLSGIASEPEALREFVLVLPFVPAALFSMISASFLDVSGAYGPAGTIVWYALTAGVTVTVVWLARVVRRASPPSRAFLQASMAVALLLQAWLVGLIFIDLG